MKACQKSIVRRPPSPIHWSDKLYLLSPRTWLGVLQILSLNAFAPLDVIPLIEAIRGLLTLIIILWALNLDPRLLLGSPWTYGMIQQALPPTKGIFRSTNIWLQNRRNALPECVDCLQENIRVGRVIRCGRYDIYLPHEKKYDGDALILFPGALLDHTAYAQISIKMADRGIAVIVISMEPTRLARVNLGADRGRIERIMKETEKILDRKVERWTIGGHSLGSFSAMRLVATTDLFSKLVMWASVNGPFTRSDLRHSDTPALVVQGSCDDLTKMNEEELEEFKSSFPRASRFEMIEGGGHSWFASVSLGDPNSIFADRAAISMQEQQDSVAAITADFIVQKENNRINERPKMIGRNRKAILGWLKRIN